MLNKLPFFALRVSLGWLFLYSGITKILDPAWSAAGYLKGAQTFSAFYSWFTQPGILPAINFINEWGLTLIGISLILGLFVRISSLAGVLLMILYYFPALNFPEVEHGFLVDEHIIYALVFLTFASLRAGRVWGLEKWCSGLPICSKFPTLRSWLG